MIYLKKKKCRYRCDYVKVRSLMAKYFTNCLKLKEQSAESCLSYATTISPQEEPFPLQFHQVGDIFCTNFPLWKVT